jgi:hypothetical protein
MFDTLRQMDAREVAAHLGMAVHREGAAPCPCCHEERRGSEDKRPPVGFRPDGAGWHCHRCGAGGDVVSLAAAVVTGEVKPSSWDAVRDRIADLGLIGPESGPGLRPAARQAHVPRRPPRDELRALWQDGRAPDMLPEDHPAVAYLRGRGFDVAAVSPMCRVLPSRRESWPAWWPERWADTWRIAVLAVNATGGGESIHARAIDPAATPKTRWPFNADAGSLLFASVEGQALLTGWPDDRPPPEVVIGEGLTGLLGAGSRQRRPVLCATSGGWGALRDVRWPRGSVVIIATDNDPTGDGYATKIREALPKQVQTRRAVWVDDHDLGDAPADVLERVIAEARAWPEAPPEARIDATISAWSAMSREERVSALADLVAAGAALRSVPRDRINQLVTLASGAPGCSAASRRILAMSQAASMPQSGQSEAWADGLALPATAVPAGWTVDRLGVHRAGADGGQVRVIRAPIVICARALDVDTGAAQVEVAWLAHDGRWTRRWVERGVVADTRKVLTLADDDAPVDSVSARDVVVWLADWEAHHRSILPSYRTTARTGWIGSGFMLGMTPLGDCSDVRVVPGSIADTTAPGLTTGGTWEGWAACWPTVAANPAIALVAYASVLGALVDLMPACPGFWVGLGAPTSRGKTSALSVAASVWGAPAGPLVATWDTSLVGIERRLGALRGLPCLLDDTSRARHPRDVGAALYLLPSGMGRVRGATDGLRHVDRWHAVGIATSEAPLSTYAEAGGAAARVLDLWDELWSGPTDLARVMAAISIHHGHLGRRVVEYVASRHDELRAEYAAQLVRYQGSAKSPVQARAAAYVAGLDTAASVVEWATGLPRVEAAMDRAWSETARTAKSADHAAAAMTRLVAWITAHSSEFYGPMDARPRSDGWLGAWFPTPAVLPALLPDVLGMDATRTQAIMREWAARGWLVHDADKTTTKVAMGDGSRVRMVRLTSETWARATR